MNQETKDSIDFIQEELDKNLECVMVFSIKDVYGNAVSSDMIPIAFNLKYKGWTCMKKVLFVFLVIIMICLPSCKSTDVSPTSDVSLASSTISSEEVSQSAQVPDSVPIQPLEHFEMSDDLFEYTLIYDGDVLKLPMTLEVFQSYGWEAEEDLSGTFNPGQYQWYTFTRGDKEATVYLANVSDEVRYISNATVYRLYMDEYQDYKKDYFVEIELPKGIKGGVSKADVIAAFGEPTDADEFIMDDGDTVGTLSYFNKSTDWTAYERGIEIKTRNDIVTEIKVSNMIQLAGDMVSNAVEISDEVTDREKNYSAPVELGNDLASYNIKIDGDLYTIPAPVSAFINNGWQFSEKSAENLPANTEDYAGYTLVKGDKELSHITLVNYSDKHMIVENCCVSGFYIMSETDGYLLPGEITVGTPESKLLALYESELEEGENAYSYYPIKNDTYKEIYFFIEDEKIHQIHLRYSER